MKTREPVPGDILTANVLDSHIGKITSVPNQKLVLIFLGACPDNTVPRVMPMLRQIGWNRSDMYEVVLDLADTTSKKVTASPRTFFQCEDPLEACESAVRFAKHRLEDRNEFLFISAVLLNVVRFNEINDDGESTNERGQIVFHWTAQMGMSLDDKLTSMKPDDGTQDPD